MIKEYLEAGEIVGTHGTRGQTRINPSCDSPSFLSRFKTLYFDENGKIPAKILSARPCGNVVLLSIDGVDALEKANSLRGKTLYLKRSDAKLPAGSYFIAELIGCKVFDADEPEKFYGVISDASKTGANDVWHITGSGGKEYLIPAIPDVVIKTDVENERVVIRPLKGIFDDED